MDHIPRPVFDLSGRRVEIPYLCGTRYFYDGLDFMNYPTRVGKTLQTLLKHDGMMSIADLEFLQAWLFFGVLNECLAVTYEDWIIPFTSRTLSFQSRLSTSKWISALRKRRSQIRDSETELQRFDTCLRESIGVLNKIIDARIMPTILGEDDQFDRLDSPILIIFSIQVLLSSLFTSRACIFSISSEEPRGKELQVQWHNGIIHRLLQRAGWRCELISSAETSIPLRFFLSCIQGHDRLLFRTSSVSGYRACMARTDLLSPRHTSLTCACEHLGIKEQDLLAQKVTNTELFNLVKLNSMDTDACTPSLRNLQIINSQDTEEQYIAFSHVRSQNLGNSMAHDLPYCQLCFLQRLANSANHTLASSTAMYIDTLSVPFERSMRRKELQNIHTIYRNATAVIVLDQALITAHTGSDIDRLVRIRISEWKSRLWTLREGLAAQVLLFKFADGLHDLEEMLENVPKEQLFLLFGRAAASYNEQNAMPTLGYLEAFALELKSSSSIALTAGEEVRFLLYTTLRLGYLSQPRYRYFCEENERIDSIKAIRLISRIYNSENGPRDDQNKLVSRLIQVYTSALEEGIAADMI